MGCLEAKQIEEQDTRYCQTTCITMDHLEMCLFQSVSFMEVYRSKKMERGKKGGREAGVREERREKKENSAT